MKTLKGKEKCSCDIDILMCLKHFLVSIANFQSIWGRTKIIFVTRKPCNNFLSHFMILLFFSGSCERWKSEGKTAEKSILSVWVRRKKSERGKLDIFVMEFRTFPRSQDNNLMICRICIVSERLSVSRSAMTLQRFARGFPIWHFPWISFAFLSFYSSLIF